MKGTEESNINVETEDDVNTFTSPFLLDHISLVFTFVFFGCLIAFLIFRINNVSKRSSYYPCNQSFHYYSLHLDLNIDSFTELHRNVKIWIQGVRNNTGVSEARDLNFTVDTTGLKRKESVLFNREKQQSSKFEFSEKEYKSNTIFMTNVFLNSSFDQVKVHFILNSDFKNFSGMNVIWSFNTAPKPGYVNFLQVILPGTSLYLTIHFIFHFTVKTESFTQINIVCLGIISVLASFPYNIIFGTNDFTFFTQFFFTAVMVSYFRYFVASQIQLEAEGTQSPSAKINRPLIAFFAIYAFTDLAISFSRGRSSSSLRSLMSILNTCYVFISIGISAFAFLKSDVGGYSRRLIFMALLEILSILIALRDQNYHAIIEGAYTPLQRLLTFCASHVFMISYLLILLQICSDIGYAEITTSNNDQSLLLNGNRDDLDVDQAINIDYSTDENP